MRKGFKRITVDDTQYLYCVSLTTSQLIVYLNDERFVLPLEYPYQTNTWRGKDGDGIFGTKEIAYIIGKHFVQ